MPGSGNDRPGAAKPVCGKAASAVRARPLGLLRCAAEACIGASGCRPPSNLRCPVGEADCVLADQASAPGRLTSCCWPGELPPGLIAARGREAGAGQGAGTGPVHGPRQRAETRDRTVAVRTNGGTHEATRCHRPSWTPESFRIRSLPLQVHEFLANLKSFSRAHCECRKRICHAKRLYWGSG